MTIGYKVKRASNHEPLVEQGKVHGWTVSWNPDDNRFYIHHSDADETVAATFAEWRNAVLWCRKHDAASYCSRALKRELDSVSA